MRFQPVGDAALRIELGDPGRVCAWDAAVEKADIPGLLAHVPALTALTVFYTPHVLRYAELVRRLESLSPGDVAPPPGPLVEIPTLYDGPDLAFVAERAGMSTSDAAALHAEPTYEVRMIGFLPGFPYLGGLPPRLASPRLASPRRSVPAGSVAIGGALTGVYPMESPGGWRLIGRTPLKLYDPAKEPGILLKPGDRVRFRPLDAREFEELACAST
jgi:inhibitor of KinA